MTVGKIWSANLPIFHVYISTPPFDCEIQTLSAARRTEIEIFIT